MGILTTLLASVPLAFALSTGNLASRQSTTTLCGDEQYIAVGNYGLINNLWGKSSATSGSQCTYYLGTSGSGIKWSTTWTWEGNENNVKSFSYSGLTLTPKLLSQINSMPSTFSWSYSTTSGLRADVAYDLFTASDPNHSTSSGDYELMVWLDYYGGIWPITNTDINSPIATPTIAGYQWKLYYGLNGSMKVYSFLPANPGITSFSGDIKQFYTYLQQNYAYPVSSQYLLTFQGGTEAFTGGPTTFTVNQYSAALN